MLKIVAKITSMVLNIERMKDDFAGGCVGLIYSFKEIDNLFIAWHTPRKMGSRAEFPSPSLSSHLSPPSLSIFNLLELENVVNICL